MYLTILNFKKMKKLYIYIILVSVSILISCIDEISPDFEFEEQVFISGLLTSDAGFVSIQIQKTVPANDTSFGAINDAQVSLFMRDTSNTVSLVSDSFTVTNGVYETTELIAPKIGNIYWIEVILQDQTILRSEEEILKPPILIKNMIKSEDHVRVTFIDQIDEENFFLIRLDVFKDGTLISDYWFVFDDTFVSENSEDYVEIDNINDGDTVRASIHNINFNTFQFYANVANTLDDFALSSIFLPINIVGNITNTATKELELGYFGVAGFSTMTKDF